MSDINRELRFDKSRFNKFVIDYGVVGFFENPVTLKSGRESHWYVNWREVANDVFNLSRLKDFAADFIFDLGLRPDSVYGVPEGATKVALFTQHELARREGDYGPGSHALPMGRGKPKEHGKPEDKYFVGMPKGRTLVLEDVTTTGGSLVETIQHLREADIDVVGAVGLTNRMQRRDDGRSVEKALLEISVPYCALSNAVELLPLAYKRWEAASSIKRDVAAKVEAEFAKYGAQALRLGE